jgi:hypothetical protein
MVDIVSIIKSWPADYGAADQLRCAAMELQDDHPTVTAAEFAAAAESIGFNRNTASRCWSFVKAQGN